MPTGHSAAAGSVPGEPGQPQGSWRAEYQITPRTITMMAAGISTFVLLLVMLITPVPFAIQGAGPTFDTLGEGGELISVEGAPTYSTSGELRLTTVTTAGGPDSPVTTGNVVRGWLSPGAAVLPLEAAVDPSMTAEERSRIAAQQMISSQENATVAALTELGYEVPAVLTVAGTAPDLGADGVLEEGDVLMTVATPDVPREPISTYQVLADVLNEAADGTTVTLGVERDGEDLDLDVITTGDGSGSVLGVFLDADFDAPVDVTIQIDNVGGPSAGTMFALGIIDTMTPGEMTGGHVIAGTGTITLDGQVGPIGGIQQKMFGALRDGAEYFLAPTANCDEVVGNVPSGLEVFAIATLSEARAAVDAIAAGDTAGLPTCS